MKAIRVVSSLAIVLTLVSSALAEAPPLQAWAKNRVEKGLLEPLAKKEAQRSRFSRALPPPAERRVRVLSGSLSRDARGRGFVQYAVDARYGEEWSETYTGCVYEKNGGLFVAVGEEHRPVDYLFGKKADPVPGACQVAPPS
jgi:hypothetical protein